MLDVLEKLRRDAARYVNLGGWYKNVGFWIGATYRGRVWANALPNSLVRLPLLVPFRALDEVWRLAFNVHISEGARIDGGLCLIHARNLMLAGCEIGENCLIFHEVTIGTNSGTTDAPKIGDNVDIYVGARVLGRVVVGDDAKIGANCVVTNNVPDGSVVVTAAPRVIPRAIANAFGARRPTEAARVEPARVNGSNGAPTV